MIKRLRVLLVLGFVAGISIGYVDAVAAIEPSVSGVDQIKRDIRSANGRYQGLSSWKIYYTGELCDGEFVNLQMTPVEAFTTVPGNTPREFLVSLRNPHELLTELGNIKELGVLVHIADNILGKGFAQSVIYVTFQATGTGQLIPLQKIFHEDRRKMDLTTFPVGRAEFLGFDREKAYFRLLSGVPEEVAVTLKLNDGGTWYTYSTTLASSPAVPPLSPFIPDVPAPIDSPRKLTTLKIYKFDQLVPRTYSLVDTGTGNGRSHEASYQNAKQNAELSLAAQCKTQLDGDLRFLYWAFSTPLDGVDIRTLSYEDARSLEPHIFSPHYPTDNIQFVHGPCENTTYTGYHWTTTVRSMAQCSYFVPDWKEETRFVTTDRYDFEELKGLCSHWSVRCIDQNTKRDWIPREMW